MSYPTRRSASAALYVQDSVTTASPGRLLVMLYDKLALDLVQAAEAIERSDRSKAHERLVHAQAIVTELAGTLDHAAGWSGSVGLASLYAWLGSELVRANIHGDVARVRACQQVVEPLRDTWHAALAESVAAVASTTAASATTASTDFGSGLGSGLGHGLGTVLNDQRLVG